MYVCMCIYIYIYTHIYISFFAAPAAGPAARTRGPRRPSGSTAETAFLRRGFFFYPFLCTLCLSILCNSFVSFSCLFHFSICLFIFLILFWLRREIPISQNWPNGQSTATTTADPRTQNVDFGRRRPCRTWPGWPPRRRAASNSNNNNRTTTTTTTNNKNITTTTTTTTTTKTNNTHNKNNK